MRKNISIETVSTTDGNKLIADFLGYEYVASNAPDREPLEVNGYIINHGYWRRKIRSVTGIGQSLSDGFKLAIRQPKLNFHNEWEDLIRIVSHIERSPEYNTEFIISKQSVQLTAVPLENKYDSLSIRLYYTNNRVTDRAETLWKTIVWFCHYYQERKNATTV